MRLVQLLVVGTALLAVACTAPPEQTQTGSATSSGAAPAALTVVVDTRHSGCQDQNGQPKKPGGCYLPLYSGTSLNPPSLPVNLAPGSTCTPENESKCWPQPAGAQTPADELKAVCRKNGQELSDVLKVSSSLWYAVEVPKERILIDVSSLDLTQGGQPVAYASRLWIRPKGPDQLPSCDKVLARG